MTDSETISYIKLCAIKEVGSITAMRLLNHFGTPDAIFSASKTELMQVEKIGEKTAETIIKNRGLVDTSKILDAINRVGARYINFKSKSYPKQLNSLPDKPVGFYAIGDVDFSAPAISIVGSRNCTVYGQLVARRFASAFAQAGYTVISGMARGIDTMAHLGALEVGGKTIAVLACGLDNIYPTANKKLAVEIIKNGGCLVSEYSPGEPPLKWRFIQRNRIISGLSEATVVMESPPKSGALITADFALEQNRDLYFHESALSVQERYNLIAQKKGLSEKVQKLRCVQRYIDEGAPCISSVKDLVTSLFIK